MPKTELDIELEKLQIEKEKFHLEEAKLQLDKEKYKDEKMFRTWTILSIVIPLITIAISIFFNMWSQYKQAEVDFVLRSVETVITADGPSEAESKLKAIQFLFPNQLPDNFSKAFANFEPSDFSGTISYDKSMNLLNLMASAGASKEEVLNMYKKIFSESSIIDAIEKEIPQ